MYPNFENKRDRASKYNALLAQVERDQRLEAMKREAYANAIWATDSEDTKQKDATENADLIKRIMSAMGSKTTVSESDDSGSKPAAPLFSNVGDIYEEMGKPTEAQNMGSEDMDAPMLQEAAMEEVEAVKKDLPPQKNQQTYKDGIVYTFKKHPELSNISFKPIIIRDGKILEHDYKLRYPDGEIINSNGKKVRSDNRMMQEVDWELTEKAVKDKVFSLMAKGDLLINLRKSLEDRERAKRLFYTWNNNAYELGPTLRSRLNAEDQQMVDSMNDEEKAAFDEWQAKQELMDVDEESKKRALEDSTVSLDTRVSKKGSELSSFKAKANVEYIYKNVDGLDQLKLRPYVKNKDGTSQAKTIYFGDDMKFFQVSDDQEIIDEKRINSITKRVNWDATLNYLIGELSTGVRKLNIIAGKEKDAQKQSLLYIRLRHILDIIKVVDPKQGADDESLLQFEDNTFQTPDQRRKKASKSISAKKQKEKDFTYEPAGKGLTGRGLRGAGVAVKKKNRSYNLVDIEGSGKASDLKYKRIGTKFIRKEDLNNNRLKLVFPNRTSVGPIRAMSNELTAMVKDLLYNDNISQQAYRALPIEDQRVFYEIVKKTHVQHTLQTPIEDPRLTLKAEFDKLRGEIQLGNDNPDMLRELYRLATDMFEQKMISSSEFKTIMSALL